MRSSNGIGSTVSLIGTCGPVRRRGHNAGVRLLRHSPALFLRLPYPDPEGAEELGFTEVRACEKGGEFGQREKGKGLAAVALAIGCTSRQNTHTQDFAVPATDLG